MLPCYILQVRNQGVTADLPRSYMNVKIPVNESIITLLLKLHDKLSGRENSYVPQSVRGVSPQSSKGIPTTSGTSPQSSMGANTGKPPHTASTAPDAGNPPDGAAGEDCRVGDGPFFIGKVLDKASTLCASIAKLVEDHYRKNLMETTKKKTKNPMDKEER